MRTYKQLIQHLWQSDFIRSFAEIDPGTGKYKRDITDADIKIFYLCDGEKCENCTQGKTVDLCGHTTDVRHAKNFKYDGFAGFWEQSAALLDRDTPKKCEDIQTPVVTWGICPTCHGLPELLGKQQRVFISQNYCSNCGQRIDWTDI